MDWALGSSLPRGHLRTVARSVHGAVDPHATDLAAAIAARHGVRSAQAVCGNGSTELIRLAAQARAALIAQRCLVRDCSSFGLPRYARVSPRHPAQNDRLPAAFGSLQPPKGGA